MHAVVRKELTLEPEKPTEIEAAKVRAKRLPTGQRESKPARFQAPQARTKQYCMGRSAIEYCKQKKRSLEIEDQKRRFDKRHGTKVLKPLAEGTTVWVTDRQEPGKVIQEESTPCKVISGTNSIYNCSN